MSTTTLLIKPDETTREFYENHTTYHPGDAGLDLFCPEDVKVEAGETVWVNLGIKCEMVNFTENDGLRSLSYDLRARSSISKTPLRLANSIGTIDSGYRGYLIAALDNIKNVPFRD